MFGHHVRPYGEIGRTISKFGRTMSDDRLLFPALNNHIAEHHLKTNDRIDWDSAECVTYSTDYYQQITLESWFTNLEQTPLNRCQQLPVPYKRLIADNNNRQTDLCD